MPTPAVSADAVPNARLEQQDLQRLGAVKLKIVRVYESAQLGCHIEISARIEYINPWIYKIRLAFFLIAAQADQQAPGIGERNSRAGQANALLVEEAESSSGKVRFIHNGVEAARGRTAAASERVRPIAGIAGSLEK